MTGIWSTLTALIAGGAVALAGLAAGSTDDGPRTALVIDAASGRDGRQLVDARLRDAAGQVRLPRSSEEALTDVRYFDAQGYRVVVSGPQASAAAEAVGVPAVEASDMTGALTATR